MTDIETFAISRLLLTRGDVLVIKDPNLTLDTMTIDRIARNLEEHFGFNIPVMVITDEKVELSVLNTCTPENPCFYQGCPECKGGPSGC